MTEPLDEKEVERFVEGLGKPELLEAADQFGTEYKHTESKSVIARRMVSEGVTWEMYQDLRVPDEDAPVELAELDDAPLDDGPAIDPPEDADVLLKMTRKNFTYEVRGYRFSSQHPFVLVKEDDADYLIEAGGFRPASPREMAAWYAKG